MVDTNGVLHVEALVAVPGIMEYAMPDGSVLRELLTAEVLTRPDDLLTLGRATVTNDHPDEDVTPANWKTLSVGDLDGEVQTKESDNGFVRVKAAVRDAQAIADVDGGKREVSPGYMAVVEMVPGTHPVFGDYDSKQLSRVYNHLAIVDRARGGHDVRLRADGAGFARRTWEIHEDAQGDDDPTIINEPAPSKQDPEQGDSHMDRILQILLEAQTGKITIDAARSAIASHNDAKMTDIERGAVQSALDAFEKQLVAKDKTIADQKAAIDAFTAEATKLKEAKDEASKPDAIQAKADADRAATLKAFNTRTELLKFVADRKVEIEKLDELDNEAIVEAVVRDTLGDKVPAEPHDTYFTVAFDVIRGQAPQRKDTADLDVGANLDPFKGGKLPKEPKADTDDPFAAQAKHVRDTQDAARG